MSKCPKCGADDSWTDEGPEFIDYGEAIQCIKCCDSCGARWREEYAVELFDTELLEPVDED